MSSTEKKRLRDRRAQQNLRDKKLRHTAKLEDQVAHCQQHHSDQGVQRLLQEISGLRMQNDALVDRQERLKCLVNSWETASPNGNERYAHRETCSAESRFSGIQNNIDGSVPSDGVNNSPGDGDPFRAAAPSAFPHTESSMSPLPLPAEITPPWKQIPPYIQTPNFSLWFAYPEKIGPCPNSPSSPLDILYGTKANPLADMIHTALQKRPIRNPERLGMGWLIYHMSRWIISPSPETYGQLPPFLRPVHGQMQIPHPLGLDFLPWPRLRLNLIRQWHLYCDDWSDLFGLFACCAKVRWPWGEDILERNGENELVIKEQFYKTFLSESGWGLTAEFIGRYPDLMSGIDANSLVFKVM